MCRDAPIKKVPRKFLRRVAQFIISGRPNTFKALRVRHGRNVYAVHSKEMKEAKKLLEEQKPAGPAVAGKAVRVRARLHFKRPKSHFKKDGSLKPGVPAHVLKRPDVDNCLKFILDALQPAVVIDDKLVVEAWIEKVWCSSAEEEKTEVELLVLE